MCRYFDDARKEIFFVFTLAYFTLTLIKEFQRFAINITTIFMHLVLYCVCRKEIVKDQKTLFT